MRSLQVEVLCELFGQLGGVLAVLYPGPDGLEHGSGRGRVGGRRKASQCAEELSLFVWRAAEPLGSLVRRPAVLLKSSDDVVVRVDELQANVNFLVVPEFILDNSWMSREGSS